MTCFNEQIITLDYAIVKHKVSYQVSQQKSDRKDRKALPIQLVSNAFQHIQWFWYFKKKTNYDHWFQRHQMCP